MKKLRIPPIETWFDKFSTPSDYTNSGVIPVEPMTAKEVMDKDMQRVLTDSEWAADEKLDGERGILQFLQYDFVEDALYKSVHCARIFSRRISKKTGFYNEKTDSLPHLRRMSIPYLEGTILDGEMLVESGDFKTTSSILNCLPEEAVMRQRKHGRVVFHAFDCLYYRGECIERLPLIERKEYLSKAMNIVARHNIPWVKEIPWFTDVIYVDIPAAKCMRLYERAHGALKKALFSYRKGEYDAKVPMTKEEYFQYIVACGGEGLMVKDLSAPYEHKRTRAYQKIKKRIYRDVVITGFAPPTKEYTGKFPKDFWEFWEKDGKKYQAGLSESASKLCEKGYIPVTRNWFNNQVGGIEYGVRVTVDDIDELEGSGKDFEFRTLNTGEFVVVGVCEGFDDGERLKMSRSPKSYIGSVFEVEGNEMFYDTGKIRHPRFYRWRPDKFSEKCTWKDHVNA